MDFDGVIADTSRLKRETARALYGVDIPAEIFKEKQVVGSGILTLEQYRALMNKVCGERDCGLAMDEMAEAIEVLRELTDAGHSLKVVTSREGPELEVAREWLANRGVGPDFVSVGYGRDKVVATQDVQVFVDDDLNKLIPLLEHLRGRLFLFDNVHNREDETPEGIRRIKGWGELRDVLAQNYGDQQA